MVLGGRERVVSMAVRIGLSPVLSHFPARSPIQFFLTAAVRRDAEGDLRLGSRLPGPTSCVYSSTDCRRLALASPHSPSRGLRGSRKDLAMSKSKDNYEMFTAKLDRAAKNLTERRNSLDKTLRVAELMYQQNNVGLQLWEDRLVRLDKLLERQSQDSHSFRTLNELRDIALKMVPMFRNRVERIKPRLHLIRARRNEIMKALFELEKSKVKLRSSRMLAQEREKLNRAVAELGGTSQGPVGPLPDLDLSEDLREAREAVILAEALMELKENS